MLSKCLEFENCETEFFLVLLLINVDLLDFDCSIWAFIVTLINAVVINGAIYLHWV